MIHLNSAMSGVPVAAGYVRDALISHIGGTSIVARGRWCKNAPEPIRRLTSEVRASDVVVVEQVAGCALEHDAASLHHVSAVGHAERGVGVLLDHEHGRPAPPDVRDDRERVSTTVGASPSEGSSNR